MEEPHIKTETTDAVDEQIKTEMAAGLPKIEHTIEAHIKHITEKRKDFKAWLQQMVKPGAFTKPTPQQTETLLQLYDFLEWLQYEVEMTPEVRKETAIESFLNVSREGFSDPRSAQCTDKSRP